MKVGDKVKIVKPDGFAWVDMVDLTGVTVTVKDIRLTSVQPIIRVALTKDGKRFAPLSCSRKSMFHFWQDALEVVT